MSPAVAEALNQRKRRESVLDIGTDSSEDVPLSKMAGTGHRRDRTSSGGNLGPVNILPPRKPIVAPTPQRPAAAPRTRTFEELNERHREKMRDLQAPLTTAVKEDADLEVAKQRWEKAKALERDAMVRKQAEKTAMLERRKRSEDDPDRHGRRPLEPAATSRHSRSLSADKLGGGSTAKRLSTMKVEDWQKYQQEADTAVPFPGGRKPSS